EMILLDMQMPGLTGLQLQEKMNKQGRSTPIIFISGQSHPQQIIESLKKGAVDFLLKPFNLADLTKAILRALELDHGHARRLKLYQNIVDRFSKLTEREKEVFELLTLGLMNIKIGEILGIAPATVKIFKANVMRKMQADSEQDLVLLKLELKRGIQAS
ncbi:MAG: DNA-binding response regulator, partial [Burkholderiaceae bacterium]|nr:DNA-binding response regulator [Burkholderiaceae bacterium]